MYQFETIKLYLRQSICMHDNNFRFLHHYHLLQTVAHKQLTTEDCSLSPKNSQIFPISKMITLHNFKLKQKVSQ